MKHKKYNRSKSLACRCSEIVEQVMTAVGRERRPADRVLRALFRERRELGSRDRRLIRETLYSVFRWWGWLYPLAPLSGREAMNRQDENAEFPESETGHRRHGDADLKVWSPLLLAAQYMEWTTQPPTAEVFARFAVRKPEKVLASLTFAGTPAERMEELRPVLFPEAPPAGQWSYRDLVPEWCLNLIDCPVPTEELIRWLQSRPPLWVRVQSSLPESVLDELRNTGFRVERSSASPCAAALFDSTANVYQLPAYQRGEMEVQDLASQFIGELCGATPGQRWWDACAGGGGKTLLLADHMQGRGKVVASDIRSYKLKDLRRRAKRGKFCNIETKSWDGKRVDTRKANFDGVLVDAPCSGSGTWRRNPDARWAAAPEEVNELAEKQLEILSNASRAVQPGGVLVYATCSMFNHENKNVVDVFLEQEEDFYLDPFTHPLTGDRMEGYIQVWPWEGDSDAMFIARMRRK